jgi:hypothetical protein
MVTRKNVFATSLMVAAALAITLVVAFNIAAAQDAEAKVVTRRVSGSWIEASVSHNAEGHSSHQVVHFFSPQAGAIYNGEVTFTSSKGVDIIVYHDITGQTANTTGLKTWNVEGRTYAITTLLTNATSGTVDFVGSGILAHSAASDPYVVAFSADGLAKINTPASSSPSSSMMASDQGMMHGQGNGMTG